VHTQRRLFPLLAALCSGCVGFTPGRAPESPSATWRPPAKVEQALPSLEPAKQLPVDEKLLNRNWTLPELIDLALSNNTRTQASWLAARSAEAALGSKRGAYYPQIDIGGQYTTMEMIEKGTVATIDYVVYDFGRRGAEVDEFRHALIAADYRHNAAIQDVILQVQQAYYAYVGLKAYAKSLETTVAEAGTNLNAARERGKSGLGTVADVLQAQTELARAQLALETARGQIQVVRGVVATAVGIPPTTKLDVTQSLSQEFPVKSVSAEVEALIKAAEAESPILAAARAELLKAQSHEAKIKAEGWPSLRAVAVLNQYYHANEWKDGHVGTIGVTFPLFTGFSHSYDVLQARTDKQLAENQLKDSLQQRALAIWSAYTSFQTAAERIKASQSLMQSASESHQVSLGRYKEGVGDILELLAAQRALEEARTEEIRARADWLMSLAQLKHDVGILDSVQSADPGRDLLEKE
jgi:outer membrane protein